MKGEASLLKGFVRGFQAMFCCATNQQIVRLHIVRACSTRAKIALVASLQRVPPVDIYKVETWGSLHAFTRHYALVQASTTDASFDSAVLWSSILHWSSHLLPHGELLVSHPQCSIHKDQHSKKKERLLTFYNQSSWRCVVPIRILLLSVLPFCFRIFFS